MTRSLLALAPVLFMAQETRETAGDLSVVRPAGWSRVENPAQGTVTFAPPRVPAGARCSVLLSNGQDFSGTARSWHDGFWKGMTGAARPAAGAGAEPVGSFLRTWGEFVRPDGTRVWLCLYTSYSRGKGYGVLYDASSQELFTEHLGTVDGFVKGSILPGEARAPAAAPGPAAAPAALGDAVILPTPPRWQRRDPGPDGTIALLAPGVAPGHTCIALIFPPGEFEGDAEAFQALAVKKVTEGGEILGKTETGTSGRFLFTKLVAKSAAGPRWIDVYTATWGKRAQAVAFVADTQELHAFYMAGVATICMNGYVPDPLLAPGAPAVPVIAAYLAGKLELNYSVDRNDPGVRQRAMQKILVFFKNGLCLSLDAMSTGRIDSTYDSRGIAGYDAAALLKLPKDRRTGRWTESGGTITVEWTLREAEKFERDGENLKSGGTSWGPLKSMDGARLEGTFDHPTGFGPVWSIRFGKDGRFDADGVNNTMGGEISMPAFPGKGSGAYEIRSWTLILRFDNGFRTSIALGVGFDPATAKAILVNGFGFDRRR